MIADFVWVQVIEGVGTVEATLLLVDFSVIIWLEVEIVYLSVVVSEQLRLVVLVHHEILPLLDNRLVEWLDRGIHLGRLLVHLALVSPTLKVKIIVAQREQHLLRFVPIMHVVQMVLVHKII